MENESFVIIDEYGIVIILITIIIYERNEGEGLLIVTYKGLSQGIRETPKLVAFQNLIIYFVFLLRFSAA